MDAWQERVGDAEGQRLRKNVGPVGDTHGTYMGRMKGRNTVDTWCVAWDGRGGKRQAVMAKVEMNMRTGKPRAGDNRDEEA